MTLKTFLPTIPLHYLLSGHYTQISISILVVRLHKPQETEPCFSNYSYLSPLTQSYMAIALILFILFIQSGFYSLRMRWHFFWVIIMCALPRQLSEGVKLYCPKNMLPNGTSISLFYKGGKWDFVLNIGSNRYQYFQFSVSFHSHTPA